MMPILAYCRSSIPGSTLHGQIRLAQSSGVAVSLDLGARDLKEPFLRKGHPGKDVFCPTVIAYDTHGQNLISDPAARSRFMPYFRDIVRVAVRCESRRILVALYEKKNVTDDKAVSFFTKLADLVPHGKKILLEVLNKQRTSFHPSVAGLMQFRQKLASRKFGFAVDTWHMHESEKNLYKTLAEVILFVDALHLKDTQSLPPGQGSLDWDRIKKIISKANYKGELLVECRPFRSEPAFQKHVVFMKDMFGQKQMC